MCTRLTHLSDSSVPPGKNDNVRFTTVPLQALSDQVSIRCQCFCFFKLFIFIYGFSAKETCAFLAYEKQWRNELSFCHKLWFSKTFIFTTLFRRPLQFQTINTGISGCVSLKYQRFQQSGCWDLRIRKFMLVVKTQFLHRKKTLFESEKWR